MCKHFSEEEDDENSEEILLVCISMMLGGNIECQNTFFKYMKNDRLNGFLEKLYKMLVKYFGQSKKFLTEKNAKLEVTFKIRQKNQARE